MQASRQKAGPLAKAGERGGSGPHGADAVAEGTRHRLLRAAAQEIARHGFKGATLRGVAARADIRAASIFHYFPGGKEELGLAMLEHIMETIATRMTPTLDEGTSLAPADLIVQCAAQLWDYMGENPEYAGALMREAFEPDEETMLEVIRENGVRIVKLATAYIEVAQDQDTLARFDVGRFLFRLASFTITFHASSTMRTYILGPDFSVNEERQAFLCSIREQITA